MRRTHGDPDAGLADLKPPQAMNNGQAMNGKFGAHLGSDFPHFGQSHRFVGLVVEVKRLAALEIVAHEAVEDYQRAIFRSLESIDDFLRANPIPHELKNVLLDRELLASAHRRKKRHFIAGRQRRAPARIFLVHGGGDGRPKSGKLRKASAVALEKVFDASALGKFGLIVIDAGNILKLPEEK